MYTYLYYGYMVYVASQYLYLIDYGLTTLDYANRTRHWMFDKPPELELDKEWVLCEDEFVTFDVTLDLALDSEK